MSGGKGNSRARTESTANTSQVTTTTIDNSIHTSDEGAIAAAFEHGQAALDLGRDSLDSSLQFAGRAGEQVGDIAGQSLANSRDALRDSLDFGEAAIDRFATFGDNALQSYGDFASSLTEQSLGGLQSLAMQTSASSDDRVQKLAIYAVLAVVAAVVLPRIFGKGA